MNQRSGRQAANDRMVIDQNYAKLKAESGKLKNSDDRAFGARANGIRCPGDRMGAPAEKAPTANAFFS